MRYALTNAPQQLPGRQRIARADSKAYADGEVLLAVAQMASRHAHPADGIETVARRADDALSRPFNERDGQIRLSLQTYQHLIEVVLGERMRSASEVANDAQRMVRASSDSSACW